MLAMAVAAVTFCVRTSYDRAAGGRPRTERCGTDIITSVLGYDLRASNYVLLPYVVLLILIIVLDDKRPNYRTSNIKFLDLAYFGGHRRYILPPLGPSQPVIADGEITLS